MRILLEQMVPIMSLAEIITGVQSSNVNEQFTATQGCRRLLLQIPDYQPPVDVVQAGVIVPRLVEFLSRYDR